MSPPPTTPDQAEAARAARAERYLALLDRAIDITARLIDDIDLQAHPEPAPDAGPDAAPASAPKPSDLVIPLEHAVRTLRLTITLAQKIADPPKPRATRRRTFRAREDILREVTDVIQRSAETEEEEASLLAELDERVDSPEMAEDLEDRPVKDLITELLRDFGLAHLPGTHPWARRTPADIRALKRRAARAPP